MPNEQDKQQVLGTSLCFPLFRALALEFYLTKECSRRDSRESFVVNESFVLEVTTITADAHQLSAQQTG